MHKLTQEFTANALWLTLCSVEHALSQSVQKSRQYVLSRLVEALKGVKRGVYVHLVNVLHILVNRPHKRAYLV